MPLSLAHVFLAISPGGSEHQLIDQVGLLASAASDTLPGTHGLCYRFDTTRLDLCWLEDEAALAAATAAPPRLRQRLRWPETDGSPFGIGLVCAAAEVVSFPTDLLVVGGDGPPTRIAVSSRERLDEPLITLTAAGAATGLPPAPARHQREIGLRDITHVELSLPQAPSATLAALAGLGIVSLARGAARLDLVIDGGRHGRRIDLAPLLPLGFVV